MAKPTKQPALWCLKTPKGELVWETVTTHDPIDGSPASCVWGSGGYDMVARLEGEQWAKANWKKWDESIASAQKLGYTFVRVQLTEL